MPRRFPALARLGLAVLALVAARGPAGAGPQPPELVFLTWADYMDPAVLAEFEAVSGVRVKRVYFEADDARDDLLVETDGRGYDVISVNGLQLEPYRRRGWLATLGAEEVPNLRHAHGRWLEAFGAQGWAVPYTWGTIGIAYRRDLVPEPILHWLDLFRPQEALRGRIGMIKNSRNTIGLALVALGHSSNSVDPEAHRQAERLLLEQKPHVRSYTYLSLGEESELLTGEVRAAMAYNGDALMLRERDPNIAFVVPEEGTILWADYLAVARASLNPRIAQAFVDFMTEPRNAARNARFLHYATPNRGAEALLPPEYFANRVVYPGEAVLARSELESPLPPRVQKLRNDVFSRVLR